MRFAKRKKEREDIKYINMEIDEAATAAAAAAAARKSSNGSSKPVTVVFSEQFTQPRYKLLELTEEVYAHLQTKHR